MKKILSLILISLTVFMPVFAKTDKTSAEYLKNKKHLAIMNPIVENVAEKNNTTNNVNVATWAKDAYDWVVENEISDGLRPTDTVTRQELWTMLHSYNTKIK